MYVKHIDGDFTKGYYDDAYIVDFWGNIFYNTKAGQDMFLVNDDEKFRKAVENGYHCTRNLTDNEIFYMNMVISGGRRDRTQNDIYKK